MINCNELNRCIEILSELNANTTNRREKALILELGYIIKQELDLVNAWESNHDKQINNHRGKPIDINKLLEDNAQLYKENETLLKNLNKMKGMIESKIPAIQEELSVINGNFNALNQYLEQGESQHHLINVPY